LRPLPSLTTGLPRLLAPPFQRAVPITPVDRTGAHVGCFPIRLGLPRTAVGSASTSSLSRPAQASRALRPAGSLSRPMATFVTRLRSNRLPGRTARQLPDQPTILWVEPPSTGVTRLRGALLSKKRICRNLEATLIQDREPTRNPESKFHLLGFICFKFQFHISFAETFSTVSTQLGLPAISAFALFSEA
jgi:hypothetical protein